MDWCIWLVVVRLAVQLDSERRDVRKVLPDGPWGLVRSSIYRLKSHKVVLDTGYRQKTLKIVDNDWINMRTEWRKQTLDS